jgi:RNA polymerase sigma-70 factor (ECF subfamily)
MVIADNMSDEEILKLSYKKPSCFGELFDRHYRRFMRTAQKTLRSEDDAEDAVQETFVRIYKYGRKFPSNGGKFIPWANTVFKNCLADQINKYKKSTVALTEEIKNTNPDLRTSDPQNEASENNRSYVQFVLKKIGGVTAEIINLRYVLGKSFKEIAKILNIKNGTARVRVYRSKKIFIQAYEQFNKYE